MLGQVFIPIFAGVAVLAGVGWVQQRRAAAKKKGSAREEAPLSDRTVENISDLNDRFNRARYMNDDNG